MFGGLLLGAIGRRRARPLFVVTSPVGTLDYDTCNRILRDAGHIDRASAICLADFTHIPDGLDARALEKYLREHGAGRSPE